jgi:D-amino peptidase
MKLFISADIEGVSGVTNHEHSSSTGRLHNEARKWMTGDVNAAIEGACAAGVTEVLVKDAHGSALNIIPDDLDERATLIQGWGVEDGMMEGLTEGFGLAFLVGYHAMAGTANGVLAHTWSGAPRSLRVNGAEMGEMGISALFAGALGVPIALITSCEMGTRQAQALLPWVEAVAVKRGITRSAAEILPIKRAHQLIREAAQRAVERRSEMKPLMVESPVTVEMTWSSPGMPVACATLPGVEQTDQYTSRFVADDQLAAMRQLRQLLTVAHSTG